MASTTFSGPVTSQNGFVGGITGNVTGNVVGNVTGAVDASGATIEIPQFTLTTLPSAATVGRIIVVTNANTGAGTVCFSNGTNWIDVKTGLPVA